MPDGPYDKEERQRWMNALARADEAALEEALATSSSTPAYRRLRPPEIGMAMVRARAGGTGQRFNMGEITVTRCSIHTETGVTGHGYVAGRKPRHAELMAVFDAMMQDAAWRDATGWPLIAHLEHTRAARDETVRRKAAATKVDFFTMVRGA